MRVSQRLDYALRALILLARQPADEYVAAGDLAERLNLPRRFVEQQVTALARVGIVRCRRGAQGGCALARSASDIDVAEVVEAIQGEVLDVPHVSGSATSEMWGFAADSLRGALALKSLGDLATRQAELDAADAAMYWI